MIALALLLAAAPLLPEAPPPFHTGNDELRAYIAETLGAHPELRARHEEWLAALEKIPQARALPDPMITWQPFLNSRMSDYSVMLEQEFPWRRTRGLMAEQTEAEAEALRIRLFEARNSLAAEVKRSYFEYGWLGEQIRVLEAQIELVHYAEEIVRSKYALGLAPLDELLRIQTELDVLEDRRLQYLQEQPALSAELNALLGRPSGGELPWPQAASFPPAPPAAPLLTAWVRKNNPLLQAFGPVLEALDRQLQLARRADRPTLRVAAEYMVGRDPGRTRGEALMPGKVMAYRNLFNMAAGREAFDPVGAGIDLYEAAVYREPERSTDEFSVSLSVNVPIWRKKYKAIAREAEHMVRAAEQDREAMARNLDAQARRALFEMQDAQRRHDLYVNSVIPRSHQAYEILQSSYASGGFGAAFVDVLDSTRALLEFELERARAVRDWQQAAARLEYLIGAPWDAHAAPNATADPAVQEATDTAPASTPPAPEE